MIKSKYYFTDKRKKRDTDQLELPRMFEIGIYSDVVSSVPHEHENINNSETNYTTDVSSCSSCFLNPGHNDRIEVGEIHMSV